MERFKESKLAVPFAIVAASLGITACGTTEIIEKPNKGQYSEGGYYFPDKDDGDRVEVFCDGNDTVVKQVRDNKLDLRDIYLNDPSCQDGAITPEDNLSHLILNS